MAKKRVIFLFLLAPCLLGLWLVFRHWWGFGIISAGDLGFFYSVNIKEYWQLPLAWENFRNSGLGGYAVPFQHFYFFNLLWGILGHFFGFILIERLVWFWPIIFLGFLDAYLLVNCCGLGIIWSPLVWLVLVLNTYFLMVVSGGQITVVFGYLLVPLVFILFLKTVTESKLKLSKIIYFSLGIIFLVAFDPRFAYLFFLAALFYFLFDLVLSDFNPLVLLKLIIRYFKVFIPTGLIALLIHFYWLLPLVIFRRPVLPEGYEKTDWLKFLSFADFSDSLSLLHPNWPENIFGKTYFFRPEFLILPILTFVSLLFINELKSSRVKKNVLFFALLGLAGAFLAKGSNPPFGQFYYWLFSQVPGMSMFRDPLKFYTLVAVSYSVLIPFSLFQIYRLLKSKTKSHFPEILLVVFIGLLLFLTKPALLGELEGTFRVKEVPKEYLLLENFLEGQEEFFRTFWIPKKQRFGFYSNNHPAINAEEWMTDTVCLEPICSLKGKMTERWGQKCSQNDRCYVGELSYFLNPKTPEVLSRWAIKYIIVPLDSEGEIFIANYQYNHQQRLEVEEFLDTIPWLKKVEVTGKIAVYELPEPKDHFFINELTSSRANELKSWKMINPAKYLVSVQVNRLPTTLVFSENYDELWQGKLEEKIIPSTPTLDHLNSFLIDHLGKGELTIEYTPQRYVNYGLIISILGIFSSVVLLFLSRFWGGR